MTYYSLELEKRNVRDNMKICKDEVLKRKMLSDICIIEKKQREILKNKAAKDEKTGSLI